MKSHGYLDADGHLNEQGKLAGFTEDWLNGTETEEHYQQYLKDYEEYINRYFAWLKNDGNPDNLPVLTRRP